MRGDGVGVGDVGEVHGGAWEAGHTAGGDDGRGAVWEWIIGLLYGRGGFERDERVQPCGDGVGVGDGARGGAWAIVFFGTRTDGTNRMRGDGVGVGDVGELHGDARRAGHTAGGDDGREAVCKSVLCNVLRPWLCHRGCTS